MAKNTEKLKIALDNHNTLTVIGANWGDEGKGKVIDLVMGFYDIVARFSGGANAGHTVFTPEGKKLVSHLIPTGLAQNKVCVLGRGEFFNLDLFLKELQGSRQVLARDMPPIYIDYQASLWTPYHSWFETYVETLRGSIKLGTTNKGIGPLEGLYKLRLAPLVGYLFEPKILEDSLDRLYAVLKPCFDSLQSMDESAKKIPRPKEVLHQLLGSANEIKDMVADTSYFLHESLLSGKRVLLLEGAQATGLDAFWGTYPYVSSGNSVAAGAAIGAGLAVSDLSAAILVAKMLPTRVGNGPFVSEMWERQAAMDFARDNAELFSKGKKREEFLAALLEKINAGSASDAEMSRYFQVLGDERGATTGRGRSLGFLDIPWLMYAIRINKPKWVALTRFDMLSKIKSIPVVIGYEYEGKLLPAGQIPPSWHMNKITPIKENWDCFSDDISGMDDFEKLPQGARNFILKLEKYLGVPILMVGTGPGREAMIVR